MTYTSAEIQAAVEKLVRSSIRRPLDTLGVRRTDITYSDVKDATAGVFLLFPESPYYVAFLGKERLVELLDAQAAVASELFQAVSVVSRFVQPVDDLTSLANAQVALAALEGALGERASGFKEIITVPSFKRFESNTSRFLNEYGDNIRDQGTVVQTPGEARSAIPSLLTNLKANHEELVRRTTLLRDALDNYAALQLPTLLAQGIVSNARSVLSERINELSELTEEGRLNVLRDVVLDLLAARSTLREFGSFIVQGIYYDLEATAVPFSDDSRTAVAATTTATLRGPYEVVSEESTVDFFLDQPTTSRSGVVPVDVLPGTFSNSVEITRTDAGSWLTDGVVPGDVVYFPSASVLLGRVRWQVINRTATVIEAQGRVTGFTQAGLTCEVFRAPDAFIDLPEGFVATFNGIADEPYTITGGVNDALTIDVDGSPVNVLLTPGVRTAEDIAVDINAAIGAQNVFAAAYYPNTLLFDGVVEITSTGPLTADFALAVGTWAALNVLVTNLIIVNTGLNVGTVWTITGFTVDGLGRDVAQATGTLLATDDVSALVDAARPGQRVRIEALDRLQAIQNRETISFPAVANPAYATIGLFEGVSIQSIPNRTQAIVDAANLFLPGATGSVAVTSYYEGTARSLIEDVRRIAVFTLRDVGTVTGGTNVTFTLADTTGASVGDTIVIRSTSIANEVNTRGTITGVTPTTITATMVATVTAGNVEVEVGPTLNVPYGDVIDIVGTVNEGQYRAGEPADIPFEINLQEALIEAIQQNQYVTFAVAVGEEYLQLSSDDTTTASRVLLRGPGVRTLYGQDQVEAIGNTNYLQLSDLPKGLQVGDLFEYFETNPTAVTLSSALTGITELDRVIEIEQAVSSAVSYTLSNETPVPFARLRRGQVTDYTAFSAGCAGWLDRAVNQEAFFVDLQRFINPLLANQNPSAVQVGDALNRLRDYLEVLTIAGATARNVPVENALESILDTYQVGTVSEIDTLIQSLLEKGADRAVDVLLEARFSDFFELDEEDASFSGVLRKSLREVARNDLPVRRVNRTDVDASRLVAELESPDFEFDFSDVEGEERHVAPDTPNIPVPGAAY